MEKLQAALARAREQRETSGAKRPVRTATDPQTARRRSRAEAEAATLAERWAEIAMFEPSDRRLQESRIYASHAVTEAQHFDILRTKLLLEMRRHQWTRIAITSATAGCGKTTTACNLIAGLGRQPEIRGMLFDMDFRRPAISKFFGVSPVASFEQVLGDEVSFAEQAMRLDENTAIAMTKASVRDPAKIILRARTGEVLDEIQRFYQPDIMIFDMPPVLISDETRAFLKLVDAVIIVAAADMTTVAEIDETEREVAQYSQVAGVVLNKCQYMDEGYGYTY